MIQALLKESLEQFGVPNWLLNELPEFPDDTCGVVLYGSRARKDELPSSDLDLLALAGTAHRAIHSGSVSVSFYTPKQLSTGIGTLFGAHLRRDGHILFDSNGSLAEALKSMGAVDTQRLFQRVRNMSQLFTTPEFDIPNYLPGLLREARYLLRSSLYAKAIEEGRPCFSVREIARRHKDPRLSSLLASRHDSEPTVEDYTMCVERLSQLIGPLMSSKHGSLEATVVNEWTANSDLLSMAFMAIGSFGGGSDYSEVEKILL